jgi:lipid A 3-O-deacylase
MHSFVIGILSLSTSVGIASEALEAPWERHVFDVETGVLWQIGSNTLLDYTLVLSEFSWRSPFVLKKDFNDGSALVVRSNASLIGTWVAEGPENHYFGISGSPSVEWWSADQVWSAYFSIGGGFGVIDSTDVVGGQGQDFTLNWFTKMGLGYQLNKELAVFGGPFFQHMSNGGATTPNPGIDALGFTIGASFSF